MEPDPVRIARRHRQRHHHRRDSLSYDIFSQAAQAIRTPQGVDTAPRVDVLSAGLPVVLNRTSLGLATGGIQLSQQAVPTAVENGINSGQVIPIELSQRRRIEGLWDP